MSYTDDALAMNSSGGTATPVSYLDKAVCGTTIRSAASPCENPSRCRAIRSSPLFTYSAIISFCLLRWILAKAQHAAELGPTRPQEPLVVQLALGTSRLARWLP